MWSDPIVEEIRSIRERIWEECDYDLKKLTKRLKNKEQLHKDRLVSPQQFIRKQRP